jgi:hypothetical protein
MTARSTTFAVAFLAATCWICLALFRWTAGGNRDLTAIASAFQRGEELAPHIEAGRHRDEVKWGLAAEVVTGKMSLRKAAGHFRRLDEADPRYPLGIPRPPEDERFFCAQVLDFVWEVLAHQQRYAAAAHWFAEAFTAHPFLLSGQPTDQRYYAARAAALASCGQGRDAADLNDKSCAAFRWKALDWLRAELEARRRLLDQEPEKTRWIVACDLHRWLEDPDFAGVRGPEALARLPAAERQAWQDLWADVADTLARAVGTTPPEQRVGSKIALPER